MTHCADCGTPRQYFIRNRCTACGHDTNTPATTSHHFAIGAL